MNLCFNQSLGLGYKSNSQKIRVMSESWVNDNVFLPGMWKRSNFKIGK